MKLSQNELLNESQFLLKKSANIQRHKETLLVEKQILKEKQKELETLKTKKNEQEIQRKSGGLTAIRAIAHTCVPNLLVVEGYRICGQ